MTEISASAEERLGRLSKNKARLLKLLLEQQSSEGNRIRPYPRTDGAGAMRLPASRAQQRLWFIEQLEGGGAPYQMAMTARLRGSLDREALRKALDTLVRRHEALRTVFINVDGEPRQEVVAEGCFALREVDLRGYEEKDRQAQVELQKIEEVQGQFDLRAGPLIRGRLLEVAAEEHVLLVTMHHIVSDGWSMGIFFRELAQLYTAYREGRADPLAPLPIQYADYAQWQRQWLQGEVLDRQLHYWRGRLQDAPPQLELPTDRSRPTVQSYRGANLGIALDGQLSAKLRDFAKRHEMTLFMVLCAGWAILLSRLSGQEDVVIGTPVANRQRPELEGLIGFFVNTLALRVAVRGDLRVKELLEQIKEMTLGAYDHQDLPFEQLVETLQPHRSLSRNPLFQAMLVLQNAPRTELLLPGLAVSLEDGWGVHSLFDLTLFLEERGEEIVGVVNYATDLFDRETIERWAASLHVLLNGMADRVESKVCDLAIMPLGEWHRVVDLFNATQVSYPQNKLVHELFEDQVRRTPEATAVVCGERHLTYAELNSRANQLARHLIGKGVGPDQLVAICVGRSVEMIVGLMGILKAGGAYVPLDPAYPSARLAYILEDAAPKVLLTREGLKSGLPDSTAEVIDLESDWSQIAQQPSGDLDATSLELESNHLAYVIYTSGSTGRPKGVAIEHRNTVNLIYWAHGAMAREEFGQTLQSTSLNFDLSVYECFVPLTIGGAIQVVENALALARSPREVTLVNTVPSAIWEIGRASCRERV